VEGRPRLVEERQRVIAQVDQVEGKLGALLGDLVDPVRGLFAEAAFSVEPITMPMRGCCCWVMGYSCNLGRKETKGRIALALIDTNNLFVQI